MYISDILIVENISDCLSTFKKKMLSKLILTIHKTMCQRIIEIDQKMQSNMAGGQHTNILVYTCVNKKCLKKDLLYSTTCNAHFAIGI